MPPNNSGLRDNHTRGTVADFLKEIQRFQTLDRLRILHHLRIRRAEGASRRIDHLDFLFGEPSFINRLDPRRPRRRRSSSTPMAWSLANRLQQKRVAKECADWIEQKVDIRTVKQSNLLHGKMYHVATAAWRTRFSAAPISPSAVSASAMGQQHRANLIVDSNRDRQELKQWFKRSGTTNSSSRT